MKPNKGYLLAADALLLSPYNASVVAINAVTMLFLLVDTCICLSEQHIQIITKGTETTLCR